MRGQYSFAAGLQMVAAFFRWVPQRAITITAIFVVVVMTIVMLLWLVLC